MIATTTFRPRKRFPLRSHRKVPDPGARTRRERGASRIHCPFMSQNPTAREPGAAAPASRAGTPASSSSNRRIKDCTRCGKPASKKKCNRCLKHGLHVYYCSEACQQTDWKVHKKTCGPKYDGTLDALDQMTLDDAEGPSGQSGSFGDFESTVMISIMSGADVNAVLPDGNNTLLHHASQRGSEKCVRALIAAGADVNKATISELLTPMHFAANSGHEAVIRALIAGGADFNSGDGSISTPIIRNNIVCS